MSETVRKSIYEAISSIRLIDPHTHIDPRRPASNTLADILGYHYYTELAHSAGMPKSQIEEDGIAPRELVHRLVSGLQQIENTANYAWLIELCRTFFGFTDERIDLSNWESLYDDSEEAMASAQWPQMVLDQSNVEAVFLTNDFDDELSGFDTGTYIPCLRTDDLVFHLCDPHTRQRLEACSGIGLDASLSSLRESLNQRFEHFVQSGARACAISLPPSFEPGRISDGRATTAWEHALKDGKQCDAAHQVALSRRVFWTLAELCDEHELPFDLMIGVNRGVYADGVYQGQDLYDSRVSLTQYRELFNTFSDVKFPVSVLASVTNQELVSHAWIFPNVFTSGHWWYSNTPSFIAKDAAARLEAVPRSKQIAYYSDAYKLEFVWPKFDMYRRVLADVLTEHFVVGNGWSEDRAIDLGRQVLRDNVDAIFGRPGGSEEETEHAELGIPTADIATEPTATDILLDASLTTPAALGVAGVAMVEFDQPQAEHPRDDALATSDEVVHIDEEFSTEIEDQPTEAESAGGEWGLDEADSGENAVENLVAEESTEEGTAEHEEVDEIELEPESVLEEVAADDLAELPLDPLPTADEVAEVDDVMDVELLETDDAADVIPDAAAIEQEAELESLDLGDLLADEGNGGAESEVKLLRGESSFSPDDESLRVSPDPVTGEWTMPINSDEGDDDVFETLEFEDDVTAEDDSSGISDPESIFEEDPSATTEPDQDDAKQHDDLLELDETVDFDEYSTPLESPERED